MTLLIERPQPASGESRGQSATGFASVGGGEGNWLRNSGDGRRMAVVLWLTQMEKHENSHNTVNGFSFWRIGLQSRNQV
jgi:hypothetical protein